MLSKFLDPKNDIAFKKIFGTEKNKAILIHFLNDMITFKGRGLITDVVFLKTTQEPEIAAQKTSIVDILCKDNLDNSYIVEMQVAKEKGFEKRAQYYASKAYISQVDVGGKYHDLKEIIFLAISDFIMFPNKEGYKSDHVILDRETLENDLKDFSFTFLELPKFNKKIDELVDMADKWSYFFKHAEDITNENLEFLVKSDTIILQAFEVLDRFSWNSEDLLIYDQAKKYEETYRALMEQKYDEGEKAGRVEGEKVGLEKGRIEGEKKAMLKIAKSMIKKGTSREIVVEFTGLSKDEIDFI